MLKARKRRFITICLILSSVLIATGLVLYALKQNINLFYTPSQIAAGEAPRNYHFRVGGMVKQGSLHNLQDSATVSFILTDFSHEITLNYTGILPDLFKEGQGIVAQGELNNKGVFIASIVLAKHDEKYMPPELKDLMS